MNSTQIEYFLTLCKYKNYSETARRLYVSQPTVSKQISALEEELGFKLFHRSTTSLHLTMQGAMMKKAFTEATDIIEEARSEAKNLHDQISENVRIAFLEGSGVAAIMLDPFSDIIQQFRSKTNISIDFMTHKQMNDALKNNEIDIGVTLLDEVRNNHTLDYTRLKVINFGIVAHKSLGVTQNNILDISRVRQLPFYLSTEGSLGVKNFQKELEEHAGINKAQFVSQPNIDSVMLNVEHGMGIAAVSSSPRVENNDELEFYPIGNLNTTIVAAWNQQNKNQTRNRIIKRLRRSIIESRHSS
ncbi:MAG: LysR family transcriptional regulator [Lachnospiraceae bacterium]|nr:LysR family transcriptional regulator [Lachnospiraceae bacterium]